MEVSGRGSHALELLTAHKITTFRCKNLATMATGDDGDGDGDGRRRRRRRGWHDDDDGDGATGDGIQQQWRQMTTTTRSMATARWATMMATLVIIIFKLIILLICLQYNFYREGCCRWESERREGHGRARCRRTFEGAGRILLRRAVVAASR